MSMLLSKIYVIKQKMQSEQIFDVVEHFYHSLNVRSVLTFMNVYEWEDLEEFFRILENCFYLSYDSVISGLTDFCSVYHFL